MIELRPIYSRRVSIVDVSGMLYTYTSVANSSISKNSYTVRGVNIAGVKAVLDLCAKNARHLRRTVLCLDSFSDKRGTNTNGYKSNRKFNPEIAVQNDIIAKYFPYFGINVMRKTGREADDLIYSAVKACKENFVEIEVITGDKDIYGCVDGTVSVVGVNSNCPSVNVENFSSVADSRGYVEYNCILPYLAFFGKPSNNLGVLKVDRKHKDYYESFVEFAKSNNLLEKGSDLNTLLMFIENSDMPEEHITALAERALLTYPRIDEMSILPLGPDIDTEKLIQFCSFMKFTSSAEMFGIISGLQTFSQNTELATYMKQLNISVKNGTMCADLGIDPALNQVSEFTPTSEFRGVEEW